MQLSEMFEEGLIYATRAHANQTRKKTGIPFAAHILGVTAIALEYGANETEAIGALLHDTVEDCGGAERLREIREKFGDNVARIVDGWTDSELTSSTSKTPIPRHGWYQRPISCIIRVRSWLNFEETVWRSSSGSPVRKTARFGITVRLSPRFASMAIIP